MVCVFARKTSEPLTSLVKQIDTKIGENKKLKGFVVLLGDDKNAAANLRTLAKEASITRVPLTLHQDSDDVPDYEIAKQADVTVVMWVNHKVKVARGYKGSLTEADIKAILADVSSALGD